MQYKDASQQINGYRMEIAALREKMRTTQQLVEPEPVGDYSFSTLDGPVTLSDLFGTSDTLFVIHNMGVGCTYCTLWADGFNGIARHLANRAAFVVSSPDSPDKQRQFALSRGWTFRMVSQHGSSFAADMGYANDSGFAPGVSVFRKKDGAVFRVGDTAFGPGDDFCAMWHFTDLIPEGSDGWQPQYEYA